MNLSQHRQYVATSEGIDPDNDGSLSAYNALSIEQRAHLANGVLRRVAVNPEGIDADTVREAVHIATNGGINPPDFYVFRS